MKIRQAFLKHISFRSSFNYCFGRTLNTTVIFKILLYLESESNGGSALLLSADEHYLNTITDNIKLFVAAHLKRCEDTDKVGLDIPKEILQ